MPLPDSNYSCGPHVRIYDALADLGSPITVLFAVGVFGWESGRGLRVDQDMVN